MGSIAVLIVNGFDRRGHFGAFAVEEAARFPWIELCLRQLERCAAGAEFDVRVLDVGGIPEHHEIVRRHAAAELVRADVDLPHHDGLDLLLETTTGCEFVVTLDNDAFPVRAGWLDALVGALADGAAASGIWRDEMAPIRPYVHPSCFCARRDDLGRLRAAGLSFARGMAQDVGQNLTDAFLAAGREVAPLRRSNAWNAHFLMGGLYGDLVYHQGAGGRRARFWTPSDPEADERTRRVLRDAAFADLDGLVAALRGGPLTGNLATLAALSAGPGFP
jgi:hypothetical protein